MPMASYPIICYRKGCEQRAIYKIAARWSDGITSELKTYALTCADCLPEFFHQSRQRQKACRTAAGETLEPPGIFRMVYGERDRNLERLPEMEEKLIQDHVTGRPGG
jgi:hypothetical protein